MQKPTSTKSGESEQQLEQIRSLILGKNSRVVTERIKKDARSIVADVLTEAVHDRQRQDGSVNKVLLPLVEASVAKSVLYRSERLVNSLYPLMGSLVRKYVTSFLTDFMEKTNQLIDNSFTVRGLKWRFNAWQAGVSFSQYVASQTFSYRVEHVLLIHRETGLLLNFVDLSKASKGSADLISSMLTAINDFVGDSFLDNENGLKEQLQTVTTDSFNLLIKPGPSVLIAAAVMGNPPQAVSNQLQITMEEIHRLYNNELNQFNGDNKEFVNCESLLRDCLLSEYKKTVPTVKKRPWFAWILLGLIMVLASLQLVQWWQNQTLSTTLMMLDQQPGIVVKNIRVYDDKKVELDLLRDPNAIVVSDWINKQNLNISHFSLTERPYYSLSKEILVIRAQQVLSNFPSIESRWQNETLILSGMLDSFQLNNVVNLLSFAGFTEGKNLNILGIELPKENDLSGDNVVVKQVFDDLVARISTIQLDFSVKSDEITPKMQLNLQKLFHYLEQLDLLANKLNLHVGLIVIGCSDNSGNYTNNEKLSRQRANNTAKALMALGYSKEKIYITGLGEIDIEKVKNQARKVLFNLLYVEKKKVN